MNKISQSGKSPFKKLAKIHLAVSCMDENKSFNINKSVFHVFSACFLPSKLKKIEMVNPLNPTTEWKLLRPQIQSLLETNLQKYPKASAKVVLLLKYL
jgi:hypothetical protein